MIVVDAAQDYFLAGARGADAISYFWLDMKRTAAAQAARRRDEEWVALVPWRSEFRNVLYQPMEHRDLALSDALRIAARAEADLEERTYDVSMQAVLRLVDDAGHSAYDCEYVVLAQQLGGDARDGRRAGHGAVSRHRRPGGRLCGVRCGKGRRGVRPWPRAGRVQSPARRRTRGQPRTRAHAHGTSRDRRGRAVDADACNLVTTIRPCKRIDPADPTVT